MGFVDNLYLINKLNNKKENDYLAKELNISEQKQYKKDLFKSIENEMFDGILSLLDKYLINELSFEIIKNLIINHFGNNFEEKENLNTKYYAILKKANNIWMLRNKAEIDKMKNKNKVMYTNKFLENGISIFGGLLIGTYFLSKRYGKR